MIFARKTKDTVVPEAAISPFVILSNSSFVNEIVTLSYNESQTNYVYVLCQ
jgi:hypothetical protein